MSKKEQDELLEQDEVVRKRGALMTAVQTKVVTVRAWDGKPNATDGAFADSNVPVAGLSVIDAADVDEVIQLLAGTPCAQARERLK